MDDTPIDELYLQWLYSQVGEVKTRSKRATYWNLFRCLYKKEFVWLILNDDNRAQDGVDLRDDFLDEHPGLAVDLSWFDLGCSFLELLIALSRRLEFDTDLDARKWFWHFIKVLKLDGFNDAEVFRESVVIDILDRVIWRNYAPNGDGGLFPLRHPQSDQTNVELWYQLNAYLIENDY